MSVAKASYSARHPVDTSVRESVVVVMSASLVARHGAVSIPSEVMARRASASDTVIIDARFILLALQSTAPAGQLLREWRMRRRMSQLDLASEAGISARHLSFVETGRSRPSRAMLLHLAENLDVPLRERNPLLMAAGYAPTYQATDFDAPEMQSVREAVERLLAAHEPYPGDPRRPAVAARERERGRDRCWSTASRPSSLEPTCNVLRDEPAPKRSRAAHREPRASGACTSSTTSGARSRSPATTSCASSSDELVGYADDMGVAVPPSAEAPRADRDADAAADRLG